MTDPMTDPMTDQKKNRDKHREIAKAHGIPPAVADEVAAESNPGSNVSGKRLASFLDRVRRLEEEKKGLAEDIKDVFSEAKATGFEPKIMKKILILEKINPEKAREELELLELYASSAGVNLPLFSRAFK